MFTRARVRYRTGTAGPPRFGGGGAPPRRGPPARVRAGPPPAHGYDTTVDGVVDVPDVGAPVSLMTCSYWPWPPSETTSRSWNFTPGASGAAKPWCCTIVGSTLK